MKKLAEKKEKKFKNYNDLVTSATNWEHSCTYQLSSKALHGSHKSIVFEDIQVSYSSREGGLMHQLRPPKNAISVAIFVSCEAEACFGKTKLVKGDIIFFDDKNVQTFMSKGEISTIILSLNKYIHHDIISRLWTLQGYILRDEGLKISSFLQGDISKIVDFEMKIINLLEELINEQKAFKKELTKGEIITFKILEDIYKHMDAKINISEIALKYEVSEKTLQNSFKALFGFTPKKFFRLLKLNLVHNELKETTSPSTTVLRVASKWGFKHMGSFSKYYFELFSEYPSTTLSNAKKLEYVLDKSCTARQEEI